MATSNPTTCYIRHRELWPRIVDTEPRLHALYDQAAAVRDDGDPYGFCANQVWSERFKPRVLELVGRDAGVPRYLIETNAGGGTMAELLQYFCSEEYVQQSRARYRLHMLVPKELHSSEAYECATDTIYSQLPYCRSCGCL